MVTVENARRLGMVDLRITSSTIRGNTGHGVRLGEGVSAVITDSEISNNGGSGVHAEGTVGEIAQIIEKMPVDKQAPWWTMLQDTISGAAGSIAADPLRNIAQAALTAMGLSG